METFLKAHVYSDGDIEVSKVTEAAKRIDPDAVYFHIDDRKGFREELLDYGTEDERVDEVMEELDTMNLNDTLTV